MATVFKVVRKEGKHLVSLQMKDRARIVYRPGRWAKAPRWLRRQGYGPTAYGRFETAAHVAFNLSRWYEVEVWLAEGRGEIGPLPMDFPASYVDRGMLTWVYVEPDGITGWYPDTRMFKELMLVKRIDNYIGLVAL